MRGLRSWVLPVSWGFLWLGLRTLFNFVQRTRETQLINNGLGVIWWSIVFSYLVLDAGLILAFMYWGNRPLGVPRPKAFPFWYLAADTIILLFLIHLSFVCLDHQIYAQLQTAGLTYAYLLFIFSATLWFIVAGLRYLSMRKMFLSEDQDE